MVYNVLLVDDDKKFAREIISYAKSFEINIYHKTNFKDMVEFLNTVSRLIVCVVLDIRCLLEPDQQVEKVDFLSKALNHLDQQYKDLPRVILTADTEGYSNVKEYFPQEKLFKKINADIISLFQFIRSLDSEKIKIRNSFPQIFEIIDKSPLNDEAKVQFLDLIKNSESTEYSQILNNLSTIRRIQESIFQSINKTNKDIIPDELFKDNGDIKFWDIHRHLKGNVREINPREWKTTTQEYYSGIIEYFSETLYKVASDAGAHSPYKKSDYKPTKFTVLSQLYALMDFIRWYGSIIK